MQALNKKLLGYAPNGQELWQWQDEGDEGAIWQEYWQPVPGGGLVEVRRVG